MVRKIWIIGCCSSLYNENSAICSITLVLSQAWPCMPVIPPSTWKIRNSRFSYLHTWFWVSLGYRRSCHEAKLKTSSFCSWTLYFSRRFGGRHAVHTILFQLIYLAHVIVGTFMPEYTCGGQRTTSRSQLSLSTVWVLGSQAQKVKLGASPFGH